jgi:alkanesulfonate monooxygenase SsuD/methylene tetrahydromethanopterin reductase-like flavin-dependent oxidoreductase (luciferase family)
MRYGFVIPSGDPLSIAELAAQAEAAGWDGVFYYDSIYIEGAVEVYGQQAEIYDPWVVMAAMAMRTNRIRLGAVLTPLARRRPWKVARETVTLDHLSGGRLVLPVGLGAPYDGGFAKVGEPTDRRARAELLDESLQILTGLWSGEPFGFRGDYYKVEEMTFLPKPVQSPRIPVWVVGAWPRERSMRRVLRYDGVIPDKIDPGGGRGEATPEDIRAIKTYVTERRQEAEDPFDIVCRGRTPGEDPERAAAAVSPYAEAGATWWLEEMWSPPNKTGDVRRRLEQGPPRVPEDTSARA